MKRIFLDTEFSELTQKAELLSIALVAETGATFYGVFTDFNRENMNDFVTENVLPYLKTINDNNNIEQQQITGTESEIRNALQNWFIQFDDELQIWADVPHYDWVLFCELFKGAFHIPKNICYICFDLATLLLIKGLDPNIERISLLDKSEIPADYNKHNALSDAQAGMTILKKLNDGTHGL